MDRKINFQITPFFIVIITAMYIFNYVNNNAFINIFVLKSTDITKILPWQIFTYTFYFPEHPIFFIFTLFIFFMFSKGLEEIWGSFHFLIYLLIVILSKSISIILFGGILPILQNVSLYLSLMVAFGFNYPEEKIYLFFIIPIRIKLLAIISLIFVALQIILGLFIPYNLFNYHSGIISNFINIPPNISILLVNIFSYIGLLIYFKKIFGEANIKRIFNIAKEKISSIKNSNKENTIINTNKKNIENYQKLNETQHKMLDNVSNLTNDKIYDNNIVLCDPIDFEPKDLYCQSCKNFILCFKRNIELNIVKKTEKNTV